MSVWTGEKVPKPRRPYTKWWTLILGRMERQPIERWSEIGYMLLSLSYEEQAFFEKEFRRIQRNVAMKRPLRRRGNEYILLSGPEKRRNAAIGLAYKRIPKEKRDSMMAEAVLPAFQKESIKRALG